MKAYALSRIKNKRINCKTIINHFKRISKINQKIRRDILSIHEKAIVAKDVLETLRKPGGTKNFAVIQGFIPSKMEEEIQIQQNNGFSN